MPRIRWPKRKTRDSQAAQSPAAGPSELAASTLAGVDELFATGQLFMRQAMDHVSRMVADATNRRLESQNTLLETVNHRLDDFNHRLDEMEARFAAGLASANNIKALNDATRASNLGITSRHQRFDPICSTITGQRVMETNRTIEELENLEGENLGNLLTALGLIATGSEREKKIRLFRAIGVAMGLPTDM